MLPAAPTTSATETEAPSYDLSLLRRILGPTLITLTYPYIAFATFHGICHPVGLILAAFPFVVLVISAAVVHLVTFLLIRKWRRSSPFPALLYLLPVLLLCSYSLAGPFSAQQPNQRDPFPSPSGKYVLSMPSDDCYWHPTISDADGDVLYRDEEGFPGWFSVYWYWDEQDRAWLYNSDDGKVWVWVREGGQWVKHEHGVPGGKYYTPPKEVYPDYAEP